MDESEYSESEGIEDEEDAELFIQTQVDRIISESAKRPS